MGLDAKTNSTPERQENAKGFISSVDILCRKAPSKCPQSIIHLLIIFNPVRVCVIHISQSLHKESLERQSRSIPPSFAPQRAHSHVHCGSPHCDILKGVGVGSHTERKCQVRAACSGAFALRPLTPIWRATPFTLCVVFL